MPDYTLHCFGESGNAYKAALMLELCGLAWRPAFVDFFKGQTRTPEYLSGVNEMGEAPVLEHNGLKLTQSGVILDYLAGITGKFGPANETERREVWRWILYDNHKFTANLATLRFLIRFAKTGETPVTEFLRARATTALKLADRHLRDRPFMIGERPTTADLSMAGYLFYGDELTLPLEPHGNLLGWLERIRALPGWKHPYELMPRAMV